MLARVEGEHLIRLHHDFRVYYHTAYEDVPTDEAIDLIRTLPAGSLYKQAVSIVESWSESDYFHANVLDCLRIINWRLAGCPDKPPLLIQRPAEIEAQKQAKKKAKATKRKIETTNWKSIEE